MFVVWFRDNEIEMKSKVFCLFKSAINYVKQLEIVGKAPSICSLSLI
jgi:hypothetical protein